MLLENVAHEVILRVRHINFSHNHQVVHERNADNDEREATPHDVLREVVGLLLHGAQAAVHTLHAELHVLKQAVHTRATCAHDHPPPRGSER
jgi:hypothetical protein